MVRRSRHFHRPFSLWINVIRCNSILRRRSFRRSIPCIISLISIVLRSIRRLLSIGLVVIRSWGLVCHRIRIEVGFATRSKSKKTTTCTTSTSSTAAPTTEESEGCGNDDHSDYSDENPASPTWPARTTIPIWRIVRTRVIPIIC